MDKSEVNKIINDEIGKFITSKLDNEVALIIAKNNSKLRKETIKIISDAMESVYKVLWQKRDFWKRDIK